MALYRIALPLWAACKAIPVLRPPNEPSPPDIEVVSHRKGAHFKTIAKLDHLPWLNGLSQMQSRIVEILKHRHQERRGRKSRSRLLIIVLLLNRAQLVNRVSTAPVAIRRGK